MGTLENKHLKINLFEDMVEVELRGFRQPAIEITLIDSEDQSVPKNALYRVSMYIPKEKIKEVIPGKDNGGYILNDGKFIKFGKELREYHRLHPQP